MKQDLQLLTPEFFFSVFILVVCLSAIFLAIFFLSRGIINYLSRPGYNEIDIEKEREELRDYRFKTLNYLEDE